MTPQKAALDSLHTLSRDSYPIDVSHLNFYHSLSAVTLGIYLGGKDVYIFYSRKRSQNLISLSLCFVIGFRAQPQECRTKIIKCSMQEFKTVLESYDPCTGFIVYVI
jgi:hypothetical protein